MGTYFITRYLQNAMRLATFAGFFFCLFVSVEPSLQAMMRSTKRKFVEKREGKAYVGIGIVNFDTTGPSGITLMHH